MKGAKLVLKFQINQFSKCGSCITVTTIAICSQKDPQCSLIILLNRRDVCTQVVPRPGLACVIRKVCLDIAGTRIADRCADGRISSTVVWSTTCELGTFDLTLCCVHLLS